ncbi:MAG TPA: hypothetical protein VKR79_05615 [Gaiellaceae bacterium]|nr:hypothetical protein [Gaiellaceae bacterium]
MLGLILVAMISAFITGALARFAVPGPDPMPAWLTVVIGLLGTAIGTGIVVGVEGRHTKDTSWVGIASFLAAVVLVVLYRVVIQKRPLWGAAAYRFPERGFGVEQARERLKRAGIDPDEIGIQQPFGVMQQPVPHVQPPFPAGHVGDDPTDNPAHYLGLLEELHDHGVLDDEQYTTARTRLLESLRA